MRTCTALVLFAALLVAVSVPAVKADDSVPDAEPLPPQLSPEESARVDRSLSELSRSAHKNAADNAKKLEEVRFHVDTTKSQLGIDSEPYKRQLQLYDELKKSIRDQNMAVLCQFVFFQRYVYPPAIKYIDRFAKRHDIEGIDFAFCKDHSSRYTSEANDVLEKLKLGRDRTSPTGAAAAARAAAAASASSTAGAAPSA
jgi:hypothetical protein